MDIALHPDFGQPVQPGQPEHNYVYAFYVVDPPDTAGNPARMRDRTAAETALPILCASRPMRRPITPRRFPAAKSFCSAASLFQASPGSNRGRFRTSAEPEPSTVPAISASPSPALTPKQGNTSITTSRSIRGVMPADRWRLARTALSMFLSEMARPSTQRTRAAVSVQNIDSLSGKILRIDPITGLGLPDNPFVEPGDDLSANHSKVYQLGLRNPFSMGFAQDGRLFISNTGWYSWEEIESGHAGANFGWPYFEGGDNGVLLPAPGYQNLPSDAARNLPSAAEFYAAVASGAITITPAYRAFAHDENAPGFQLGAIVGVDAPYSGSRYPAEFQNDVFFTDVDDGEVFVVDVNNRSDVKFLYSTQAVPRRL